MDLVMCLLGEYLTERGFVVELHRCTTNPMGTFVYVWRQLVTAHPWLSLGFFGVEFGSVHVSQLLPPHRIDDFIAYLNHGLVEVADPEFFEKVLALVEQLYES